MTDARGEADFRLLRDAAHHAFDALWTDLGGAVTQSVGVRGTARQAKARRRVWRRQRDRAYAWLAHQLGVPIESCHFGRFDAAALWRVRALCAGADPRAVRSFREAA